MALTACTRCRMEISNWTRACPHCGHVPPRRPTDWIILVAGIVVPALLLLFVGLGTGIRPEPPRKAKPAAAVAPTPAAAEPKSSAPEPTPSELKASAAVANVKHDDFCLVYGRTIRAAKAKPTDYSAAMVIRGARDFGITVSQAYDIGHRRPAIGMNTCAVLAALGRPDRWNRSVFRSGEHHQLVYKDSRIYVYLENGIVTSFQD